MADLSTFLHGLTVDSEGENELSYWDFDKRRVVHRLAVLASITHLQPTIHSSPPLSSLAPITLAEMKLGSTHSGRFIFGTLCIDAFLVYSIATCLEVEPGMAVPLFIHNALFPTSSVSRIRNELPKGCLLVVKEPYLHSLHGSVGILIRNLSDIEKFDHGALENDELLNEGKRHFQEQNWECAIDCYTRITVLFEWNCLTRKELSSGNNSSALLAYSNRAEAWMKLKDYERAFQDSCTALKLDPSHVRSLFWKGRAAHRLHRYEQACASLKEALQKNPESQEIQDALQDSRQCYNSEKKGKLDLSPVTDFLIESAEGRYALDPKCSNYTGPVVVRMTHDERGRGLFACRDLKVGEFLIISNPLALPFKHPDINNDHHPTEDLIAALTICAKSSPKHLKQICSLQADTNCRNLIVPPTEMLETRTDADWAPNDLGVARIRAIVKLNTIKGEDTVSRIGAWDDVGIWFLPSFINHSCTRNAKCRKIGRAMFIHAATDIKEGEEITISYFDTLQPLLKREEQCQALGFRCECKRCSLERNLSKSLEDISNQYSEPSSKVSSANPTFILSQHLNFVRLAENLEKVLRNLNNLTWVEKSWVRASYCKAYLAAIKPPYFSMELPESLQEVKEQIVEFMMSVSPGHLIVLLLASKQYSVLKCLDGNDGSLSRATDKAMDACLRFYGMFNPHVLQALMRSHASGTTDL